MKMLKFLHIGDMHLDPKYAKKIEQSLNQIIDFCKQNKTNGVIIPGDIWHCKQSYSNSSAVPLMFNFLRNLSKLVDFIFITNGNHDTTGSIALLHQLEPNIYAYEYPVCLGVATNVDSSFENVVDLLRSEEGDLPEADFIVSLIPYPHKSMFISETSIDNNNEAFLEKFEQIFELIGDATKDYSCPKLLGFHGNVVGSRLSTGQTLQSQDIMVAPSTLEKANADYYALNHIHLRQEIKPNMIYAGGIANFNWGETEQKSFEVVEFDNWTDIGGELEGKMSTHQIMLESARPMIKEELQFHSGEFFYKDADEIQSYQVIEGEYRLRIEVKENDRKLITEEKIQQLKNIFGEDVKIEFNIIPTERESRSEKIMNCKNLYDEVKEYAAVVGENINGSISMKVAQIQEVGL